MTRPCDCTLCTTFRLSHSTPLEYPEAHETDPFSTEKIWGKTVNEEAKKIFLMKYPVCNFYGEDKHNLKLIPSGYVGCSGCLEQMSFYAIKQIMDDMRALRTPEKISTEWRKTYYGVLPKGLDECMCKSLLWGHENGCPMLKEK